MGIGPCDDFHAQRGGHLFFAGDGLACDIRAQLRASGAMRDALGSLVPRAGPGIRMRRSWFMPVAYAIHCPPT